MKKALSIALFLSVLLTAGCKGTNEQTSLPRGEVSPEWAAAAESFYADADFDWISEFFASNQARMPGTQFYYNFFSPYIIAAILEKTSGTSVMDYITPRLLEPLHITDMEWVDTMTSKLVESGPFLAFSI